MTTYWVEREKTQKKPLNRAIIAIINVMKFSFSKMNKLLDSSKPVVE